MKGIVVFSTTDNPNYSYYERIVKWAWEKLGWKPVCYQFNSDDGYRRETLAQVSRLYAGESVKHHFGGHTMVMTSDVDMIPLRDYWNPSPDCITTYGHDLTDFNHVPICYIAMTADKWCEVMPNTMHFDLLNTPKAKSDIWEEWWQVDQDIITKRLKNRKDVLNIPRGTREHDGLPIGRVDRYNWYIPPKSTWIDCHALRPGYSEENYPKLKQLLLDAFGEVPEWLDEHTNQYRSK